MNIIKEIISLLYVDKSKYQRNCDLYLAYFIKFFWFSFFTSLIVFFFYIINKTIVQALVQGELIEDLKILFTESNANLLSQRSGFLLFWFSMILGCLFLPKTLKIFKIIENIDGVLQYNRKENYSENKKILTFSSFAIIIYGLFAFFDFIVFAKAFFLPLGLFSCILFYFSFLNMIIPYTRYNYLKLKRKHCKVVR